MTITNILDLALPFSASDHRCGMKKRVKIQKRMQLAALLNGKRNGKPANLSKVKIMVDFATFEKKVDEWIAALKK